MHFWTRVFALARTCSEEKDSKSLAVFSYGSVDVRTCPETLRTVLNRHVRKKGTFRAKKQKNSWVISLLWIASSCCFFVPERIRQTFWSHGHGVSLIIKRTSKMESSGNLRSELYTTFFSCDGLSEKLWCLEVSKVFVGWRKLREDKNSHRAGTKKPHIFSSNWLVK